MPAAEHQAITAIWRLEGAKIIASVSRIVRDVGLAEELAQDALVAALEKWPRDGIPDNTGAWLMATAKNRALDYLRRLKMQAEKHDEIGQDMEALELMVVPDISDGIDERRSRQIDDDL
ncbi:MAG: sigma factor, partial [Betaproteobacteria bacterium]